MCEPYYGQPCTVLEVQKGDNLVVSLFPSPPLDHISQRILAGGGVGYTRYRKPGAPLPPSWCHPQFPGDFLAFTGV